MDTPIFAEVTRRGTDTGPSALSRAVTSARGAHEAGRDGGTSVTDLLGRQTEIARTDAGRSADTVYVGHVPGLLSFRLPA
ncbi:hypothetical protein [Actinomycetospora chibensis]|uniref:Uncharacterized protein n=1 Tax=Actinomycetospora chibensis TaxID=663606 RepID=A0ABV9RMF9_9PSEU|nr:hypothetical protein [Actinomycetospora chibensis]MDD7922361.1 hypothetical protein [Actinomycetospora chibensis]